MSCWFYSYAAFTLHDCSSPNIFTKQHAIFLRACGQSAACLNVQCNSCKPVSDPSTQAYSCSGGLFIAREWAHNHSLHSIFKAPAHWWVHYTPPPDVRLVVERITLKPESSRAHTCWQHQPRVQYMCCMHHQTYTRGCRSSGQKLCSVDHSNTPHCESGIESGHGQYPGKRLPGPAPANIAGTVGTVRGSLSKESIWDSFPHHYCIGRLNKQAGHLAHEKLQSASPSRYVSSYSRCDD